MCRINLFLAPFALLVSCFVHATGQTAHDDYFEVLPLFWQQVYAAGGETLYCGDRFGPHAGRDINVEHVYPMSWALRPAGCSSRDQCRQSSRWFNRIEADMHNLYPARIDINKARGSFPFGMIKGEARSFGQCDFELDRKRRMVEPRPAARGNIARAMFYMMDSYGLKIYLRQAQLLLQWHREDPPDQQERERNDLIEKLQGTRNRFIDDPQSAENLRF